MILTFQVIITIVIVVSIIGVLAEKKDTKLREHLMAVFITSIAAFVVTALWL